MPAPVGTSTLVSLDDVKAHLLMTNAVGVSDLDDGKLAGMIDAATPVIEDIVGPVLEQTITAEQHNTAIGSRLALLKRPVLSVEAITEYNGKAGYPVTVADTPAGTGTYSATLDGDAGVLTRWAAGSPRDWASPVYVTYTAGRPSVPPNIEEAALELVRHMWETQRGRSTGRAVPGYDEEQTTTTPSGYLVPPRVAELLKPHDNADGFA